MSLLHQIVDWSTTDLAPWQQDALRRLFKKQVLDLTDYDDLYAMMKAEYKIYDSQKRQALPLTSEHIPIHSKDASRIILRSMKDLKHVNCIANEQTLTFSTNGITVMYGANASGKSGYSRVLKLACRARDDTETVHPNVFEADFDTVTPMATFQIEVDGKERHLQWKRGDAPPQLLSTVAVFDGRCARAYLDDEQDVAFIPYGLDILENLCQQVLPEMAKRLEAELSAIDTDLSAFSDLLGETAVGNLIAGISVKTDIKRLKQLATLEETETKRLVELDEILSQPDPLARAKEFRLQSGRVNDLIARIDIATSHINDSELKKIQTCHGQAQEANKAASVAAANWRAGEELLPGTGEQTWKLLFDSAKRFSTELAYPDKEFPYLEDGARCPLCQQSLNATALKRLKRFDDFLKDDTAKTATEKSRLLKDIEEALSQTNVSFNFTEAMCEELKLSDPTLSDVIKGFEAQVQNRKKWLLDALATNSWAEAPQLGEDPQPRLKIISAMLIKQAEELEKVSNEDQKRSLESERLELKARSNLSSRLQAVEELVGRMNHKDKLAQCKNGLKTRAISDKTKEFSQQAVTKALRDALDREFEKLGIGQVKTILKERTDRGIIKHKLLLDIPIKKEIQEILSEGEQRAIAIGSFLAELQLSNHVGAIVFDDPVSSLDHVRRKRVAQRFVEEARKRQVIVFTHNVAFLRDLWEEANRLRVEICPLGVETLGKTTGIISNHIPWSGLSVSERVAKLDELLLQAKKCEMAGDSMRFRALQREYYDLLRATWERSVEELLFNKVIERLEVNIKVMCLDGVAADFSAIEAVLRGWQKASAVIDSHDHAVAEDSPPNSSSEMEDALNELKNFVKNQKQKRKDSEKKLTHFKKKMKVTN
ncbi:MAG: AAA family ATPase [Pseudomonadota bacterium]